MAVLSRKITYCFLWIIIFTVPFQKSLIGIGPININRTLGICLVAIVGYSILLQKNFKKPHLFYFLTIIFIFWNILSFFWATDHSGALSKSMSLIQVSFISWVIYEFASEEKELISLFKSYVLGCFVISFLTIYYFLTVGADPLSMNRFFLEGYNPNELGTMWALGLPMAMYMVIKGKKIYSLYIPLGLFTILLTGSRTAFILLVIMLVSTIWMLFKYRIRFRKLITSFLVLAVVFITNLLPTGQFDRLSTVGEEVSNGTLNGRTGIWESGILTFKDSPLYGVGSGSFLEASIKNSTTGIEYAAHNSYLSVLVENGLVGFILFVAILSVLFISAYRIEKGNPLRWLCLTLVIAWLTLSIVSHAEVQKYTWIIFGLVITAHYINKTSKKVENVNFKVKKRTLFKRIVL